MGLKLAKWIWYR